MGEPKVKRGTEEGRKKLKQKQSEMVQNRKKKLRRGIKTKTCNIKIFSTNANDLGPKKNSFESIIKNERIKIFTLQETHLKVKEKVSLLNINIISKWSKWPKWPF